MRDGGRNGKETEIALVLREYETVGKYETRLISFRYYTQLERRRMVKPSNFEGTCSITSDKYGRFEGSKS